MDSSYYKGTGYVSSTWVTLTACGLFLAPTGCSLRISPGPCQGGANMGIETKDNIQANVDIYIYIYILYIYIIIMYNNVYIT
jgi:hypothetical protein